MGTFAGGAASGLISTREADNRPLTEKANSLAQTINAAEQRLEELCRRVGGEPRKSVGIPSNDVPQPMAVLPFALEAAEQAIQRVHDRIAFIEARL